MNALVVGEKIDQTASLANYLKKNLQPEAIYAATFRTLTAQELEILGGAGVRKIFQLPENGWLSGGAVAARALAELVKSRGLEFVAIYASKKGNEVAARLAQRLDASYASEVFAMERMGEGVLVKRLVLGGGYVESVLLKEAPRVVSAKFSSEALTSGERPEVELFSFEGEAPHVKLLETIKPERARIDLEKANLVVAVGRGFKKKEDLKMAEELARLIGAELGCSRPISGDLKWLEEERHIGLSGKRVRPSLYIALGISGQVQHLVGMRDSKTVVAVNTDPNAPLSTESDYYFVADLYKILPTTIEILKKKLGS